MRIIPILAAGGALAALAACAMNVPGPPMARTADQQAKLTRLTGGKVPGQPIGCLPQYNQNNMSIIDGHTIAYGFGSGRINVVTLGPGCEALDGGFYALKTNSLGTGLCSGDIAQVVDLTNGGMVMGSCVIGPIVPWDRPGR